MNLDTTVTSSIIQPIHKQRRWLFAIWKPMDGFRTSVWRLSSRRIVQIATLDPDPVLPSSAYPSLHKGDAIHPLESR